MEENNNDEEQKMPLNYRPSLSTGVYGVYVTISVNAEEDEKEDEKEEKIDYREQIQQEMQAIRSQPNVSRNRVFELAKNSYKTEGKPVTIDKDDVLSDIQQNAANYNNVALPMTLAQDKDFNTWNEQQFKQEFSSKFNIPIGCIEIISVRAGSTIIDLKLKTHSDGNQLLMPIEAIAEKISTEQAKKGLVEFGIFAMEFGKVTAGFDITRQKVIMNPRWNREYGPGYTVWDGPLSDGKSRGGEPYYCPKGWKRFAIQFQKSACDFDNVYDKWPIAYHGTKFDFSMMITLSGLKVTGGDHGCGVYTSPSLRYCAHPRYAKPIKLNLNNAKQQQWSQDYVNEFKKYDGKWVQCVFMLRVKPGSFIKRKETMSYWNSGWSQAFIENGKFDNINITEIEWVVQGAEQIIGPDKILIYGVMIRALDSDITGYNDDCYIK